MSDRERLLYATGMWMLMFVYVVGMALAGHKASALHAENIRLKQAGWDTARSVNITMDEFDHACFNRDLGAHWW